MIDPMYPFQSAAAADIVAGKQVYLGFDPGLGKSRTALDAAQRRKAKRILVIAPASGRYVWESEARKWAPSMPFHIVSNITNLSMLKRDGIVVVTYGLLSQKDSPFAKIIASGEPFDMTVLDEAAAVKNPGANRTKAILGKMLPKLGYVLPLSGTPAPNHAGELYPILKALWPKALAHTLMPDRTMLQWEFEDAFCRVTSKRFGGGPSIRVIEGSKNLDELRRRLDGFMIRVKKEDVLKDLPSIRYDTVPVEVDISTNSALSGVSFPEGLGDEDMLKYLSGATGDEHIMRLRRILGLAKTKASIEYLDDFMTNLPGDKKILVFAHHKEVISFLVQGLQNWNPVGIVGSSTQAERSNAVMAFLQNPHARIFIGNIQAAGTGLTLVGPKCRCSDVFFVEASYSVGDNVQAAARVHRIGQHEGVVARFLTAHGTIDDRIQSILARKAKDFEQLFN